jgi:transposase-like protein
MAMRHLISRDALMKGHVCPKCNSKAIERVHQDVLERISLMLRRKRRYRCLDCDHRFCDRPLSKR